MEEVINALRTAIEGEKKSLLNYLDYALNTDDYRAKDMFVLLALDEFNHFEILSSELNSVKETGEFINPMFSPSDIARIIPSLKKINKRIHETKNFSEKQAIEIALNLEDEARKFYLEQAQKSDDRYAKEMWFKLAEMEESHYQLLMSQTYHLRETGYWLNIKEFSLEISED